MRRLAVRLIVLFTPFALGISALIILGLRIGELVPMWDLIRRQRESESVILYSPLWRDKDNLHYKLQSALVHQPQVMVIGSSRVLHFRNTLNLAPDQFYNAGVPTLDMVETRSFLNGLAQENAFPPIIIMGIDMMNFNIVYPSLGVTIPYDVPTAEDELNRIAFALRQVFQTILRDPSNIEILWNGVHRPEGYTLLGINGIMTDQGYRADGSRYQGGSLGDDVERRVSDQNAFFDLGLRMYTPGGVEVLNEEMLIALEDILKIAESEEAVLIGVLLPFRETMYLRMTESGQFEYMSVAMSRIQSLFEAYEAPLYDFSTPQRVGGTDEELYDTWHPGELLSLRIFTAIARDQPELFAPYVDMTALDILIAEADNPFYIFSRTP